MLLRVQAASHNGRTEAEKRRLQLAKLDQIARTGRILLRARRDLPDHYDRLLRQFNITAEEACNLITVYQSLALIKEAEQLEHDQGNGRVPGSAREALDLLAKWQKTRH